MPSEPPADADADAGETARNVGYAGENHDALLPYEDTHWWFVHRNRLITWMIGRHGRRTGRYLEIGCGNGCVTRAVAESFPELSINATEYFETGLANARLRLPEARLFQLDARDLDGSDRYDIIGAFDVIEHIDDDAGVIAGMARALAPGGIMAINVPQHAALWSAADDYARHQRRYSRADLHAKLEAAGLEIVYSTSFVALLSPLMWLHRRLSRGASLETFDIEAELAISRPVNALLGGVCRVEHGLRRLGVPLPVGGSRAVIARKPRAD